MPSNNVSRIKQTTQRGFCASLLIAALTLGVSAPAQASLLGLTLNDAPDISVSFISTSYDSGTGAFTADGFASSLDGDAITGGGFDLDAIIDNSGNLTSGMFSITGTLPGFGPSLLSGTLTDFGSGTVDDVFEFLFTVDDGDLASLYGGVGNLLGGIILHEHGFGGDWGSDFVNVASPTALPPGFSDVGVVPVPAAVWLFGSALLGLAGFGRHTRRKQIAA